ncbi:phosphate acyltransferase PlsX [Hutsoniella sourekii]
MKIALDIMGGDDAPEVTIQAADLALSNKEDLELILFGDEAVIRSQLKATSRVEIVGTSEVITGEDEPVSSIRRKKDASMVVAARAVKEGQADGLVSAGNTGALLAAGLLIIGRMKNVQRPGLMAMLPTLTQEADHVIMMDVGANADTKAENMHQFAILANFYASRVFGKKKPRIGLLNNGTEEGKGSSLTKEAFQLLKTEKSINFIGNIEAKELLKGGVDIVISDGFTGNAVLKAIEGSLSSIAHFAKETLLNSGLSAKLGAGLALRALKKKIKTMDLSTTGGAVLLGVKRPVIKAHGSSDAQALKDAILQAASVVESGATQVTSHYFDNLSAED